tara:strand:- start:111 stop:659 length:549 start_codon:yes stop_codon:yes gene_type:complete
MTFEETLIKSGLVRQKNLLGPSTKASAAPDTGVTILKKSAYYVIRDCADITQKYLPHLIYSSLDKPINHLRGKFSQAQIIDFVGRSKTDRWTKQLLNIVLTDIGTVQYKLATGSATDIDAEQITSPVFDYGSINDDEDVYGDYNDDGLEVADIIDVEQPKSEVNVDDVTSIINKLIEIFEAK